MIARSLLIGIGASLALFLVSSQPLSAAPKPILAAPHDGALVQHVDTNKKRWRNNGTHVRAPFTDVDNVGSETYVRAPFARVYNGKAGTWVRAPFVNLWIPR